MNRSLKKLTTSICAVLLSFCMLVTAFAETTSEKLENAQKDMEKTEDQLDKTQDTIDQLKDSRKALESSLNNLNDQLTDVSKRLENIEEEMRQKQDEIDAARTALAEAEEAEADQYAYLKTRLKVIYESGNNSFIDLLFNNSDFAQLLNKAMYIEKMNEYDRQMLQKMKDLKEETRARKEELEAEERELESLKGEVESEQAKVEDLVSNTSDSITSYAGAISEKEKEALAYEARLIANQNTITALKEQLAKEEELARLAAKMKKRNLSEVSFAGSDRDLLAAIIQCEAGGEPYAGKIAVGAVIMNRVCSGAFPDTVVGVVYQPGQFQPVRSGRLAIRLAEGANDECYRAADEVMAGANNIGNCLFFRTVVPGIQGTIIGNHVFYLHWTGKESGYGDVEESLKEGEDGDNGKSEEDAPEEESDDEDNSDDDSSDEESEEPEDDNFEDG
ncbi:MAG: cell wall hydrolase [Lachnospiraceae bacterium]|nr:cell wall hydrolase [Lachnospiraceae bacterium]